MPRKSRIDAPGFLHHVIARGIERRAIFEDDTDRNSFLNRLGQALEDGKGVCLAWALLPNHFHLLLKTGSVPLSNLMKRLLTGYAVSYNLRHGRQGHLFQNRYKSILCQEASYLLELVRYIHLNCIRANVVADLKALDRYPYSGHSVIMGRRKNDWQDVKSVLTLFEIDESKARRNYRSFVRDGISQGMRPDLIGGGLIRSAGGWTRIKALRQAGIYQKGDERILGDSDFVEAVLWQAEERMERKEFLAHSGTDLEKMSIRVAELLKIAPEEIWAGGKERKRVMARSLLCFWAVRELGMSETKLSRKVRISQPAVSQAVKRGEELAKVNNYRLVEE